METMFYIVIVEAAIHQADRWLIIKRSEKEEHAPGLLSLVAGKVEVDDAANGVLESTLRREVLEEVGVEVGDELHYLESKFFLTDKNEPVVDIVFVCKHKSGEPMPLSGDEVAGVQWMSCDEILRSSTAPIWLKQTITKAETFRLQEGSK